MDRRHEDDSDGSVSRRDLTKSVGIAALSLPVFGASSVAASGDEGDDERGGDDANEYETVTVESGETARFTVGSGETLENLLIDVTADGADAQIVASGENWTVRNVGFRGRLDIDGEVREWARLLVSGTGTVERVYLGDGSVGGVRATGGTTEVAHSGHIDIIACHFAEWPDNAFYAAHSAEPTGGGGTVQFRDCYFRDNNVSHLRMAADGDRATGCVVHNTGNVPPLPGGQVDSKGVFTYYGDPGQTVSVRDCQIDVTSGNTNGGAAAFRSDSAWSARGNAATTIAVADTASRGRAVGEFVEFGGDNSDDPKLEIPDPVPESAEAAARGPDELSIDEFEVIPDENPAWPRYLINWTVSGRNLSSVTAEVLADSGSVTEAETTPIRGNEASGTHEVRVPTVGDGNEIRLSVADESGRETAETEPL